MKKLLSILICILLAVTLLSFSAFAANDITLVTASDTIPTTKESTVSLKLNDSDSLTATSIKISILEDDKLRLVSGKFADFEGATVKELDDGHTSITFAEPTEIKGDFFTLNFTADEIGSNLILKFNLIIRNESSVKTKSIDKKFKAVCSEHKFSDWDITTPAVCEEAGSRTRVCSVCKLSETEEIAALTHDFSEIQILREATCLSEGYQRIFCKHCKQKKLEKIPPTGHIMGDWTLSTASSCEEKGTEISKCKGCELTESREIAALGHEFKEADVTTEPTIGKYGVKTGYCVRCNQTTDSPVECAHTDKATGIRLDTKKGVYPESSKAKVSAISLGSSAHSGVAEAIAHITNQFFAYNIEVSNLGFPVEPEGDVTITFPVPEKFGKGSAFYYITSENTIKKLTVTLNEEATTATVKFMGNGRYAICKTAYAADDEFISPASVNGTSILIITILILVMCWGIVALKIIKAKNPRLYRKIMSKLPTVSEIRNAVKRNIFILKKRFKKPQ